MIEFRNASWWTDEVFEAFRQHQLVFCSVNYPKLPTGIIPTAKTAYVRMHGSPRLFYSEYSDEELSDVMHQLAAQKFKQAFVYFNNTASTAGILNALTIRSRTHLLA